MGSAARSTRSNAAPAGRQSHEARSTQRPQLHVVSNRSANGSAKRGLAVFSRRRPVAPWRAPARCMEPSASCSNRRRQRCGTGRTNSTARRLVHIVVAVVFLGACLLGALLLRTQMSSNSFEASRIEQHITMLQGLPMIV